MELQFYYSAIRSLEILIKKNYELQTSAVSTYLAFASLLVPKTILTFGHDTP